VSLVSLLEECPESFREREVILRNYKYINDFCVECNVTSLGPSSRREDDKTQ
jgi:hypothetical protein